MPFVLRRREVPWRLSGRWVEGTELKRDASPLVRSVIQHVRPTAQLLLTHDVKKVLYLSFAERQSSLSHPRHRSRQRWDEPTLSA